MSHESNKAAPEVASEESVTTESAESQEQPTTTPDGSTAGTFPSARGAEATTTDTQSITVTSATSEVLQGSKMSPEVNPNAFIVAYADSAAGHRGVTYQALGFIYCGLSVPWTDKTVAGKDHRSVSKKMQGEKIGNRSAATTEPSRIVLIV